MNFFQSLIPRKQDSGQFALALIGPAILLWPFLVDLTAPQVIGGWLVNWVLIARHNYILHNHVHHPFSKSKALNRLLDVLLAFTTGMTAGNWKITHVHGHHTEHMAKRLLTRPRLRFLETTHDKDTRLRHNISRAIATMPVQFVWPVVISFKLGLMQKGFRSVLYRYAFWEMLFVYIPVCILSIYDYRKTLIFIITVHVLVMTISRYTDRITHSGADETDEFAFANICLSPTFNYFFWNFGYHIAHHLDPKLHWSELKQTQEVLPIKLGDASISSVLGLLLPKDFVWRRVLSKAQLTD
jgi:fatty acid desaturase